MGVGAYASGPVVAEAAVAGIPAVAVEMDAHLGWTNRILSLMVDKVCLSFPVEGRTGGKYLHTGRPIRPSCSRPRKRRGSPVSAWNPAYRWCWSLAGAWEPAL